MYYIYKSKTLCKQLGRQILLHHGCIVYSYDILCQHFHASHYAVKYILPTEHATELSLKNMIAEEDDQQMKETNSDHTRAVLNCDHPASSGSTADPVKNSAEAVSDFLAVIT